jgi:hypothetical protein
MVAISVEVGHSFNLAPFQMEEEVDSSIFLQVAQEEEDNNNSNKIDIIIIQMNNQALSANLLL